MLRLPPIANLLGVLALAGALAAGTDCWAQKRAPGKAKAPASKGAKAGKTAEAGKAAGTTTASTAPAAPKRRDPFQPLISKEQTGALIPTRLPPGKAGLVVSTLRVDGCVRAPNGMLAVVTNPQQRTYFLREGDRLYDGRVEQINMEGVSFKEEGKDPFGKAIDRIVVKRIYPTAGEQ